MIGLSIGINATAGQGRLLQSYRTPDNLPVVLVIDAERNFYGLDTSGSLLSYRTPDGTIPSLVLDFETANYGVDP